MRMKERKAREQQHDPNENEKDVPTFAFSNYPGGEAAGQFFGAAFGGGAIFPEGLRQWPLPGL